MGNNYDDAQVAQLSAANYTTAVMSMCIDVVVLTAILYFGRLKDSAHPAFIRTALCVI